MATPGLAPIPRTAHGLEPRGLTKKLPYGHPHEKGKFGRMFPYLNPRDPKAEPTAAQLGLKGGPMDSGPTHNDNPKIEAGYTYLGQFIDHDITFDPTSSFEQQNDPRATENFRTPALELDNVYGSGPDASPQLYDNRPTHRFKLLLGPNPEGGQDWDQPRNSQGVAIIGDPRNDENLIVSQLHTAFLRFHNAVMDMTTGVSDKERFIAAQQTVRWHYQWIVVNEYLTRICGKPLVDDILTNGRKFYYWGAYAFLPVEFSVAAFRFGHSMVQPGYGINATFGAALFSKTPGQNDLRGGIPVPEGKRVNWVNFFDTGHPTTGNRTSSKMDAKLAGPLLDLLPFASSPESSLAFRNLKRGESFGLPSGQDVAQRMGETVLTDAELWGSLPFAGKPAPLWYYCLKEAEVRNLGEQLGPVGGRIVAETLIGLLAADKSSFLYVKDFKPTLPAGTPGKFTMTDLLTIAGVPIKN